MNPLRSRRRLNSAAWRRRYRSARSTLLHFKLTLQTLDLPNEPMAEQLPEAELERFLERLLLSLRSFTRREARLLAAAALPPRSWRIGELLPLLDLFDETHMLSTRGLPESSRLVWRKVGGQLVRLKALVVHCHVWRT